MRGDSLIAGSRRVIAENGGAISRDKATGRAALREAMRLTGATQKAMAISADIEESNLSAGLKGDERRFDIDWLTAQDDAFLVAWIDAVMQMRGLTRETRAAIRAQRIGELVQLLTEGVA